MIYSILKNLIKVERYKVEEMADKLDIFLVFDRITTEQYDELVGLMNEK